MFTTKTNPKKILRSTTLPFTINYRQNKVKVKSEVAQSCLTLCDPMDCSLPGSSTRGILQARVLEWVAISFSRRSSQPRDKEAGTLLNILKSIQCPVFRAALTF